MLTVNGLVKTFGSMTAVKDVSFVVEPGTILGLIGQNGAGKTTTFRMILQFLWPEAGTVRWQERALTRGDYDMLGYLPEERGLNQKMTVEEQILFFAELRGKKRSEIRPQIDGWMEKFDVKGRKKDKIKNLSKGNQQKVQLIATLIHHPKLIILDEPFSGLDPVNAGLLKDGILQMKQEGACIIFSSHNMENVEQISDRLVMLRSGQTVLSGTVSEVRESFGRTRLYLESPLPAEQLEKMPGVSRVERAGRGLEVTLSDPDAGRFIFRQATAAGYIPAFNQQPPTLEDIFKLKAGASHG
ncbi:MAG: ABC transporter ATP-binding protein [Sporolactobacillus sp.]